MGSIRKQHNHIFTKIEKIINSVKVEYAEEDLFTGLQNFCRIRLEEGTAQYKKEAKGDKHQEESLPQADSD